MSLAIIVIYINITNFVLISSLEKDHSMIETLHLKNVVIFIQAILSFVLSRQFLFNSVSFLTYFVEFNMNLFISIYQKFSSHFVFLSDLTMPLYVFLPSFFSIAT